MTGLGIRLSVDNLDPLKELGPKHLVLVNELADRDLVPLKLWYKLLRALDLFKHQVLLLKSIFLLLTDFEH